MPPLLPNGNQLSSGNEITGPTSGVVTWQRDEVLPSFQENLKAKMKMRGLNQPGLAKRIGVAPGTVNRWLKDRIPGGLELLRLARVLDVDPFELVGSSYVEPCAAEESPRVGRPPRITPAQMAAAEQRQAPKDEPSGAATTKAAPVPRRKTN